MPMSLTDADFHKLDTEEGINAAVVKAFNLYRVDSHEGKELMGQSGNEDFSGIVFHGFWPGHAEPRLRTLRRNNPPMEADANGILQPQRKYLNEVGRGNKVWFGPNEAAEVLTDVGLPIVLTEGPKKLCALWRLARYNCNASRFLACALNGVWGWRGVIGKVLSPTGQRVDEKGVIPDFDRITWAGRVVVIIFDSDCTTNAKVAAARRGLVQELRKRGARVAVVDLPVLDGLNG